MKHFYCSIFLFLFSITSLFSQSNAKPNYQTKHYTYTFSGNLTSDNLKAFEDGISTIEFIQTTKIKYKSDSKKGIIYFQTSEKTSTREGDSFFEIKKVKQKIEEFGLIPLEFTSEN